MFSGSNKIAVDNKGRLMMPASYRESIMQSCGGNLVITRNIHEKCLTIYPGPAWLKLQEVLEKNKNASAKFVSIARALLGNAKACNLDSTGRILVPRELKEYANIENRVVLAGISEKFELWAEDSWNEVQDKLLAEIKDDAEFDEILRSLPI